MPTLRAKLILIILLAVAPSVAFIVHDTIDEHGEGITHRTYFNLAGAALGLTLGLGIAWRMGNRMLLRPLSQLAAAAAPYADAPSRRGINPAADDEIALVHRTLDQMAATVAQQRAVVALKELVESRNDLLQAVSESQKAFIGDADSRLAFRKLLDHALRLTESRFGLLGEIRRDEEGRSCLRVLTLDESQSRQSAEPGFPGPDTLLGAVVSAGEVLICNDPAGDARAAGWPPGFPPLHSLLALPLQQAGQAVGLLAVANRAEGYDEGLAEGLQPLLDTAATLIGAFRNEERRREAEASLRRLNSDLDGRVRRRTAELQASLQELESFSYSISHDLRTPLRGINGFATILAHEHGERLDGEAREHLARIRTAAVHMGELIDQLIELARITRAPVRAGDTDLTAIAGGLAHELRQLEPERSVRFELAADLRAHCDPQLIRVALGNLFSNAWKYTGGRADACIEFGRCEGNGETAFYVRDNGAGFDMAFVDKLFKPFQRLHQPGQYQGGGGIGLATVRRVVLRHGGKVWAESSPGNGATFSFTLPS